MNLREVHSKVARLADLTRTNDVVVAVDEDDCAFVSFGNSELAITTDFINSSPAVLEVGAGTWGDLGQLAVCHNLADLAGSGCIPLFFLTGICAPHGTSEADILEFTSGVCAACKRYGCALIGGDTKFGPTRSIFGTAVGKPMSPFGPFVRSKAEPGFSVVVSGPVGSFCASVLALHHGKQLFTNEELDEARRLLRRDYVPFDVAGNIAKSGRPCAGTDISDGLGTDLADICASSSVAVMLDVDAIPVDDFARTVAGKLSLAPWTLSFATGGDFACLFAVEQETAFSLRGTDARVIGEFNDGPPCVRSRVTGRELPLLGHQADRRISFGEEILNNAKRLQEQHVH